MLFNIEKSFEVVKEFKLFDNMSRLLANQAFISSEVTASSIFQEFGLGSKFDLSSTISQVDGILIEKSFWS